MNKDNSKSAILEKFSTFVGRNHYSILIFFILLSALSIYYTIHNLGFMTDRNDLISHSTKYYKDYAAYREEFKDFDDLLIAVEGSNKQHVKNFVEELAGFLLANPKDFKDVFYKIDPEFINSQKLLFLDLDELHKLKHKLAINKGLISSVIQNPGLESLFNEVNKEITGAKFGDFKIDSFDSEEKKQVDLSLPISVLEQMIAHIKGENVSSSPWQNLFIEKSGDMDGEGYLTTKGKQFYFIFVNPVEDKQDFAQAVDQIKLLRNYIKNLEFKYSDVTAGVTGSAALSSDEMISSKNDTIKASFISIIGVAILLIVSLKGFVFPLSAVFTLIISVCLSIGFTTLTVGHLNVLSVVFTTILIGLGIDFGIHFIMRFQEEMAAEDNVLSAITKAVNRTGKGIIAGAITTSFAFAATMLADFKGIAELGFIAGTGIIICLIVTMTLLPSIIIIIDGLKSQTRKRTEKTAHRYSISNVTIHPVLDFLLRKPKVLIGVTIISILLSFFLMKDVSFDYNILNLQADGVESVDYEKKIIECSGRSALYGAVVVDTFDEILPMKKMLEALPSVDVVNSIDSIIPANQDEKLNIIQEIPALFSDITFTQETSSPVNLITLSNTLNKIYLKIGKDAGGVKISDGKSGAESYIKVRRLIADFNRLVKNDKNNLAEQSLNEYQNVLFADFNKKLTSFAEAIMPDKIDVDNIPEPFKERFIGKTGKYFLQVFPKINIYERGAMDKFTEDIRSVDPNATGPAITSGESGRLMKKGYVMGGLYAFIAIIIFIRLSFKSLRYTLLSIIPLTVGAIWTLAIMGIFNLRFNLANLIILPLIIGIGVDNGIHIVHRFRDDIGSGNTISPVYKSTGKAVILSSLTTTIGFGSLMVASHRGIHSIGVLLTIGVLCCLAASLTILPAILEIMQKNLPSSNNRPG
ncbi:MAG: MMPL family transporter [Candidatus Anammoxibacter sp.]